MFMCSSRGWQLAARDLSELVKSHLLKCHICRSLRLNANPHSERVLLEDFLPMFSLSTAFFSSQRMCGRSAGGAWSCTTGVSVAATVVVTE